MEGRGGKGRSEAEGNFEGDPLIAPTGRARGWSSVLSWAELDDLYTPTLMSHWSRLARRRENGHDFGRGGSAGADS